MNDKNPSARLGKRKSKPNKNSRFEELVFPVSKKIHTSPQSCRLLNATKIAPQVAPLNVQCPVDASRPENNTLSSNSASQNTTLEQAQIDNTSQFALFEDSNSVQIPQNLQTLSVDGLRSTQNQEISELNQMNQSRIGDPILSLKIQQHLLQKFAQKLRLHKMEKEDVVATLAEIIRFGEKARTYSFS